MGFQNGVELWWGFFHAKGSKRLSLMLVFKMEENQDIGTTVRPTNGRLDVINVLCAHHKTNKKLHSS